MKNEKGFTLIEILAVITILGLLVAIAIPAVNKELANFRMKYYRQLENTIKLAGQEYIGDKRFSKPTKLLYTKIIKADDMVEKNYMSEYRDYNKKECDKEDDSYSYVVVVKTGEKSYEYQTCLKCSNDEYYTDTSDTELDLCNPAWLTNDNITYGGPATDDEVLWVYYGSDYNEIERQVGIKYGITKRDNNGNVIASIDDPTTGGKEIYPDNINELTTATLDEVITLKYTLPNDEVVTKKAKFYRYEAPKITMTYGVKNEYSGKNVGDSYNGNSEWANTISIKTEYSENDQERYAEIISKNGIGRLEYNTGSGWKKVTTCNSEGGTECTWNYTDNYEGKIKFRLVDKEGHKSKETGLYSVKVDKTEPTATLTATGAKDGTTFVGDVTLTLTKSDNLSRVGKYGLDTSINYNSKDTLLINSDSNNTYYGYVMDKAGNENVSSGVLVNLDKEYIITLNGAGSNNPVGSTTTKATYGSTTLSSITNPGKKVTVSFNRNGTGAAISGTATAWDSTIVDNYTFNGWYTANSGGTKIASNATTPVLEKSTTYTDANNKWNKIVADNSVTLYAHWTHPSITLPRIRKTGHTCRWDSAASGNGTYSWASGGTYNPSNVDGATARTMYAICTPNTYTITYNYNGGTAPTSGVPTSYKYGVGTTINGTPTMSRYGFTGWTGSNGTTPQKSITISTTSTGNKTYTANWEKIPTCTITASPRANGNGWNNTNVTVTLNITGNATSYGLSDSTKTPTNKIKTLTLTSETTQDGKIIYGYVKNAGGGSICLKKIKIDKTPPPPPTINPNYGENINGDYIYVNKYGTCHPKRTGDGCWNDSYDYYQAKGIVGFSIDCSGVLSGNKRNCILIKNTSLGGYRISYNTDALSGTASDTIPSTENYCFTSDGGCDIVMIQTYKSTDKAGNSSTMTLYRFNLQCKGYIENGTESTVFAQRNSEVFKDNVFRKNTDKSVSIYNCPSW